jgi:hypothetical protein
MIQEEGSYVCNMHNIREIPTLVSALHLCEDGAGR